ncbi:hypothetical protein WMF38_57260 [Sorangium sp. So ce118]
MAAVQKMATDVSCELVLQDVSGWTFGFIEKSGQREEPLARDLDIAHRLGYARPAKVRDLIKSLMVRGKLNDVAVFPGQGRSSGGRPAKEFWLTEAQALKVAAKSETDPADALLDEMIQVYMAARASRLPPAASTATLERLDAMVRENLSLRAALRDKEEAFAAERHLLLASQRSTICDDEFAQIRGLLLEVVDLWLALGKAETKRAALQLVKHRAIPGCFGKGFRLRYLPKEQVPGVLRALEVLRSDAQKEAQRAGLLPSKKPARHPLLNLRK